MLNLSLLDIQRSTKLWRLESFEASKLYYEGMTRIFWTSFVHNYEDIALKEFVYIKPSTLKENIMTSSNQDSDEDKLRTCEL